MFGFKPRRKTMIGGAEFQHKLRLATVNPRKGLPQRIDAKAQKLARENEILTQQGKAIKQPAVMRKQPLIRIKADLRDRIGRQAHENRIALRVQPAQ